MPFQIENVRFSNSVVVELPCGIQEIIIFNHINLIVEAIFFLCTKFSSIYSTGLARLINADQGLPLQFIDVRAKIRNELFETVLDIGGKMENISDETLKLIKYATIMEINGRSFYEHVADMTHNELGKKMFRKLAEDEIEHITTFGEIFTSVLGSDEWKKHVQQEENNKETVLEKLKTRVKKEEHEERASDLEALRIGMELERESIDQYEKWAQETSDAKVQEIFKKIIEEEKFHYDLLQAEYDNITNTGFWFDMAEFRMDGKF